MSSSIADAVRDVERRHHEQAPRMGITGDFIENVSPGMSVDALAAQLVTTVALLEATLVDVLDLACEPQLLPRAALRRPPHEVGHPEDNVVY